MPKRTSKHNPDVNQVAFGVLKAVTEEPVGARKIDPKIDPSLVSKLMSQIGRRGGLKGGKARAEALTASKRKAIAQKAAKARWSKKQV
jgi:hypothetical protein